MTYKSIDHMLQAHEDASRLKQFVPAMDLPESDLRTLWMTPALHTWCYQNDSKKTRDYKANIRAFLKRFVIGGHVDNCVFMKNWIDDVWEIRVQLQPRRENTRIFGAFAKANCFVATHQKLRSELGNKDDPRWKVATDKVVNEWIKLFPGENREPAFPFNRCLTFEYADERMTNGGVCP